MKDEIKEINIPENVLVALGDLTNGALNYYKATETVKVKHNIILDYITNLQEKYRQTKLLKERHQLEKEVYKSRNEKANNILKDTSVDMPETLLIETIDWARHILNGGDDNE